jgi:hypothetical protein
MRLTIFRETNSVGIDGRFLGGIDCSGLDSSISVVQWDETKGHIEFINPPGVASADYKPNIPIDSLDYDDLQTVISLWQARAYEIDNPPAPEEPPPPPPPTKEQLKDYAAACRYKLETKGFVSNTFGPLYSDRETTSILGNLVQSIDKGMVVPPVNFKGPSGWTALDGATITAIAQEVAQYVQTCFNLEMQVDAEIDAGTLTTFAEVAGAIG